MTKVQGRVAGRRHLLLNHPPLDPFGSKEPTYLQIYFKSQFSQKTLVSVHCTIVHQLR